VLADQSVNYVERYIKAAVAMHLTEEPSDV
jgi:hypothetical protein